MNDITQINARDEAGHRQVFQHYLPDRRSVPAAAPGRKGVEAAHGLAEHVVQIRGGGLFVALRMAIGLEE